MPSRAEHDLRCFQGESIVERATSETSPIELQCIPVYGSMLTTL